MSTPDYEAQQKAREEAEAEARGLEQKATDSLAGETMSAEDADQRGHELEEQQAAATQGDSAVQATGVDLPPAGQSGTAQPLEDQPEAPKSQGKQRKS